MLYSLISLCHLQYAGYNTSLPDVDWTNIADILRTLGMSNPTRWCRTRNQREFIPFLSLTRSRPLYLYVSRCLYLSIIMSLYLCLFLSRMISFILYNSSIYLTITLSNYNLYASQSISRSFSLKFFSLSISLYLFYISLCISLDLSRYLLSHILSLSLSISLFLQVCIHRCTWLRQYPFSLSSLKASSS